MISKCKKNYKLAVAFILGIIVSGLVVYAATIESSNISYDNSSSGLSSTTLKGAIDELYEKVPKGNKNIVAAYTYNEETCITGEESTCKNTKCYESKTGGSCPSGTIIEYKVNNQNVVKFSVMYDKGETIIMQSQTDTVSGISWGPIYSEGPTTAINTLENVTASWTNVENQTYTMGTTVFATNQYTGCIDFQNCKTNSYTWSSRTAKARMITVQEIENLGSPKWIKNYITSNGYYTMNVDSSHSTSTNSFYWFVSRNGINTSYNGAVLGNAARAVVVVKK